MVRHLEPLLILLIWVWAVTSPFIVLIVTVLATIDWYSTYQSVFLAVTGGFFGAALSVIVLLLIGFILGKFYEKTFALLEREEKYGY